MFSLKGIPVKIIAAALAVIALVAGIWLTFFHSAGFVKTTATIVSVEDVSTDNDGPSYRPTVQYTVDGTTYTGTLDVSSGNYKVGKTLAVLYDPNDPSAVHDGGFVGVYLLVAGAVILAVIVVTEVRKKKALKEVKAVQTKNDGDYPASVPGPERKLYFLTDLGTAKAGHRIEDANREVLYEAKMTKFTLTTPYGFDFIDHEHDKTTPHLIGHEEESDWGGGFLLDNHYTFTFDGEDIWKHLKRNGITVESSLTGMARTEYVIMHDGKQIAVATSSPNVHEEDEGGKSKLASLVPVRGFYRVRTTEKDLSLLFVTLLAFARSGALNDEGGMFGKQIRASFRNK